MEKQVTVFLLCFQLIYMNSLNRNGGCQINPFVAERSPFLIDAETKAIVYPTEDKLVDFIPTGQKLILSCPGSNIMVNGKELKQSITVACKSGETFDILGTIVEWNQIVCTYEIKPNVREVKYNDLPENTPNKRCDKPGLKIIQIGFIVDVDTFLNHIDICFDTKSKIAVYSYSTIVPSVNNRASNVPSPGFKQDEIFYGMAVSLKHLYDNSQSTINDIVGLDKNSTKYVNNQTFINRGHLSAKANFVYRGQQRATYRYINAAPQWNSFNGGNWNILESDIRNYASENKVELQVWTGTYGISSLPTEDRQNLESLYLYINKFDTTNSPSFPIPEVFWKLVYDPVNNKGVIFIGHNNPYEAIESPDQKLCETDVTESITWLNWDKENLKKGFSYACACSDAKFQNLVSVVPQFNNAGLLN